MTIHHLVLFQPVSAPSTTDHQLTDAFKVSSAQTVEACLSLLAPVENTVDNQSGDVRVIIADFSTADESDYVIGALLVDGALEYGVPVVLLAPNTSLSQKLKAFEVGFDDCIGPDVPKEEISARILRAIFNQIANEQLKNRLDLANATAFTAMADNSDLGSNIQFLLDINRCANLDELGQTLFRTISHYGLSSSLQMRSLIGTKNMEANGMAKDLESQLLTHMKDAGRYVDFSHRTIINYGQCSLLIRNMPVDDDKKYGAVKDNTFSLVQGVDARIKALDEHQRLLEEKETLKKLSARVQDIMTRIDNSYQQVMREIVTVAEDTADSIQSRIPVLALSEEQERFLEEISHRLVRDTTNVFNRGLQVDECFQILADDMANALARVDFLEEATQAPEREVCYIEQPVDGEEDQGVELF